jgi:IS5 family transposase
MAKSGAYIVGVNLTNAPDQRQFSYQPDFRPPLPDTIGPKEFLEKRALYETVDDLLVRSRIDQHFVSLALQKAEAEMEQQGGAGALNPSFVPHCYRALRCTIVRFLEDNMPVRDLSVTLADSHLFQWFCHIGNYGSIKTPSKSTLDRYQRLVSKQDLEELIGKLLQLAGNAPQQNGESTLGLEEAIDLGTVWLDSTCLEANIHFPTDWVLLIDATRTLMKATLLIRKAGLKNRMGQSPEKFLGEMNKQAIAMSQQRRRKDSKTQRKKVLRVMKKLVKKIASHAHKHRQLLASRWKETEFSEGQAQQIIERIDQILAQLPEAQRQAHERIIGGRQIKSEDKILSLYEADLNVIVRGKLNREVEFGNSLLLGEQRDGLIIDWQLHKGATAETKMLMPSVERMRDRFGAAVQQVCADRGLQSKANEKALQNIGMESALCPRNIDELRERMKEDEFAQIQKRRSQTEARISIVKRCFLGTPLRAKGFANRELCVSWAVLAHNLWVLSRLRIEQQKQQRQRQLAKRQA